ncbi:putative sprt family metallopeptidase [Erysiphe necator]|uniref:Putative sprt family metallopeptidase n=1 Tax=Uncinula necator TaxID=52586 RepID=A0A0B1NYN3_UNCNE|nr:putative sprt family metallopeptidase [Erysiphe necator]
MENLDSDEDFPNLSDLAKQIKDFPRGKEEISLENVRRADEKNSLRLDERQPKVKIKETKTKTLPVGPQKRLSRKPIDGSDQNPLIGVRTRNKTVESSFENPTQIAETGTILVFPGSIFIKPLDNLSDKNDLGKVPQKGKKKSQNVSGLNQGNFDIDSEINIRPLDFDNFKKFFSEDEYISESPSKNIANEKIKANQKTDKKISRNQSIQGQQISKRKISLKTSSEMITGSKELEKSKNMMDKNRLVRLSPQSTMEGRTILASPKKAPRIPLSPHRVSSDAFWQQDIITEWNDRFSPSKILFPTSSLSACNDKLENPRLLLHQVKILAKADQKSRAAKKQFSEKKVILAESFLLELDDKITGGEISRLAASSGGVKITWNKKLNSTAGRANWKCEKVRSKNLLSDDEPPLLEIIHHAAIELAEKVIDDEERLLNVMAHEFCHLATFMISNIKTNPHGREFKSWATKCSKHFADRGVHVTTKHNYDIDYKYVWKCENCGVEVKRHSKSVDPIRHRCGTCMSKLVQIKPVPRSNFKTSEYQTFVRENMKTIRENYPGSPQKEIMSIIGKKYQEIKASRADKKDSPAQVGNSVVDSVKDKSIDFVAENLNNLSLD